MTQLYLIRHTQAEGNLYRMMQGHWDGGITSLGVMENDLLSARFQNIPLDAAYSSDLKRAVLTAEACVRGKGIPVVTDRRLRELDLGPWETRFFGNIVYSSPKEVDQFLHSPGDWWIEGAETVYDVEKRAFEALTEIAESHPGKAVAVVSHGITIRCLLTKIMHLPYAGENLLPIFRNTAVTSLQYEDGVFTVEQMNDASHLSGLPVSDWLMNGNLRDEVFNPEDDPALYSACYQDTWKISHNGSLRGYREDACLLAAANRHKENPDSVRKLFLDNEFAGLIDCDVLHGAHAGYGWISLLYLTKEFRGKAYGVQLLARAIVLYKQLGRHAVRLHVSPSNTDALTFYRKQGFHILQTEPTSNGAVLLMEKQLGENRHVF